MPILTGQIAQAASFELPEEWKLFGDAQGSSVYGTQFLSHKLKSVMFSVFKRELTDAEQALLEFRVTEYLGKLTALQLIGPAIDYYSKQYVQLSATGRNEFKQFSGRVEALKDLRLLLLEQVADLYPEVAPLLPAPGLTVKTRSVPSVRQSTTDYTPDPNVMEPAFDVTATRDLP